MKHLKAGQQYKKTDGRSTEVYIIIEIQEDLNATWIKTQTAKDEILYYGKKAFKENFQLKEK